MASWYVLGSCTPASYPDKKAVVSQAVYSNPVGSFGHWRIRDSWYRLRIQTIGVGEI